MELENGFPNSRFPNSLHKGGVLGSDRRGLCVLGADYSLTYLECLMFLLGGGVGGYRSYFPSSSLHRPFWVSSYRFPKAQGFSMLWYLWPKYFFLEYFPIFLLSSTPTRLGVSALIQHLLHCFPNLVSFSCSKYALNLFFPVSTTILCLDHRYDTFTQNQGERRVQWCVGSLSSIVQRTSCLVRPDSQQQRSVRRRGGNNGFIDR